MRFQKSNWDCGPASAFHAAIAFDLKPDYLEIIKKAQATKEDGTNEKGMSAALRYCGLTAREFECNDQEMAWRWLHGSLISGRVVVLCVDSQSHWICCVGSLGSDKVILIDSSKSRRNKKVNGIHIVSEIALMRRWKNARILHEGEKKLYAISAGR